MASKKPTDKDFRIQNLEFAILNATESYDEIYGLMVVFREYIRSENFSKYTAENALNGIFSLLIKTQVDLGHYADMEV